MPLPAPEQVVLLGWRPCHGRMGVRRVRHNWLWKNKLDFKKIIEKITVSEEDELEGIEPRLDFVWIDMTRSGDKRLTDPSWYRDFEMLITGATLCDRTLFPGRHD